MHHINVFPLFLLQWVFFVDLRLDLGLEVPHPHQRFAPRLAKKQIGTCNCITSIYIYTLMIDYILQDYAISISYNHIYVIWKSSSGIFLPIITPAVHVIDAHLTWTGWNPPFSMVKFVADKRSETVGPNGPRCISMPWTKSCWKNG